MSAKLDRCLDEPRLSSMRMRSLVEFYIDAFAVETGYAAASTHRVRDLEELSPSLERLVQDLPPAAAWRAWTDGGRTWFVRGELADTEDGHQRDVLIVFYGNDAESLAAGVWRRVAPSRWQLISTFPVNPHQAPADRRGATRL